MRFSGFEGEWENKTLGEICEMQAGKFVSASEIYERPQNESFPCYGGNGLRGYTRSFNQNGLFSLIGRQGALCGNITLVNGKFHATEHAVVVTPMDSIETVWMYYLLTHLNLNRYATGAAQPGLSVQNLEKVEAPIPKSKKEQEKISSLLYLIDQRIQTQKKIIEEFKLLKNTLVKDIFSQKLTFKSKNGKIFPDWRLMKLENIGSFYAGGDLNKLVYRKEKSSIYSYPIYANGSEDGLFGYATTFQYPGDSITVSGRGNLGKANVRYENFNAIVRLIVIKPKPSINPKYLEEYINNINFIVESTGVPQLTIPQISKYSILIPHIEEQNKIGNFFSIIDKKIEMERELLDNYQMQKEYLLKNMFI